MTFSFLHDSLTIWLKTFAAANDLNSLENLLDGYVIVDILCEISDFFQPLKQHVGPLTRVESLSRIVGKMVTFISCHCPGKICQLPSVLGIVMDGSFEDMREMIRLILVCAVKSDNREKFIEEIMRMEESVQLDIMRAIQKYTDPNRLSSEASYDLIEKNEYLTEKCLALEEEISLLKKSLTDFELQQQIDNQQNQMMLNPSSPVKIPDENLISSTAGDDYEMTNPMNFQASSKAKLKQEQLINLREKYFNLESMFDGMKGENTTLLEHNESLLERIEQNQSQIKELTEELEASREELAQANKFIKKASRQRQMIEEASASTRMTLQESLRQKNEALKRLASLESSRQEMLHEPENGLDMTRLSRKQQDNEQLSKLSKLADTAQLRLSHLENEHASTSREKTKAVAELNRLKSLCGQFIETLVTTHPMILQTEECRSLVENLDFDMSMKSSKDVSGLSSSNSHCIESLAIMDELEVAAKLQQHADGILLLAENENSQQQVELGRDSRELKYQKLLEKSREVILRLFAQNRCLNCANQLTLKAKQPDKLIEELRTMVTEKERIIENLEKYIETMKEAHSKQEREIRSAWYHLALQCNNNLVSTGPTGGGGSHATTFLDRQRNRFLFS